VQWLVGLLAGPLLLVSLFLLMTGRGPDNLGMGLLVVTNVVTLTGLAVKAKFAARKSG
jgi:hypothetical protein